MKRGFLSRYGSIGWCVDKAPHGLWVSFGKENLMIDKKDSKYVRRFIKTLSKEMRKIENEKAKKNK